MIYVEPTVEHLCDHTKSWYELRARFAENGISVGMGYEEGPFWAREVKNGFMHDIATEMKKHKDTPAPCDCDKTARMDQIRRILNRESVKQEGVGSRIQIDARYADIERLFDLNPDAPQEPVVISITDNR